MRFKRLDLIAFGPFAKTSISLDQGDFGLHLVFGNNEAGKSSALRALTQFLYGIPNKSTDNFVHSYADMRIGGVLEGHDGAILECIRRKGRLNTLRRPDDTTAVEESELQRLLAGIDEPSFTQRFGLSYASLVTGGEEIASGKGELGEVLFAAGTGIANLRTLRNQLANESDELFKRNASKPKINAGIAEIKELQSTIKSASLSTNEWRQHHESLEKNRDTLSSLDAELHASRTQFESQKQIAQSLPLFTDRDRKRIALKDLGHVPVLSPNFAERRIQIEANLKSLTKRLREYGDAMKKIDDELATLIIPDELLQRQASIDRLYTSLGRNQKDMLDRSKRQAELEQLRRDQRNLLRDLGRDESTDIESLRLSKPKLAHIRKLAQEQGAVVANLITAKGDANKLRRNLAELESQLQSLPKAVELNEAKSLLKKVQRLGDLDEELASVKIVHQKATSIAEKLHDRLELWSGTLAELERLAVPAVETIDRFDKLHIETDDALRDANRRFDEIATELQSNEEAVERLRLYQDVPTEADLTASRELREQGWKLVRLQLDGKSASPAELEAFCAELKSKDALPGAYETSVAQADAVADRLRREAQQVAEKSQLLAERTALERRRSEAELQLDAAHERRSQFQAEWSTLWSTVDVKPRTPREMRSWCIHHANVIQAATTVYDSSVKERELEERVQTLRTSVLDMIQQFKPESKPSIDGSLSDAVSELSERVQSVDAENAQRKTIERDIDRERQELLDSNESLETAQRTFEGWQGVWREALVALEGATESEPVEMLAMLACIDELIAKHRESSDLERRIHGIDRDAADFEADVAAAVKGLHGFDDANSAEKTVLALQDQVNKAERLDARKKELIEQRDETSTSLKATQDELSELVASLRLLCQEAEVTDAIELPRIEEAARLRDELKSSTQSIENQLAQIAGGKTLDELSHKATNWESSELHSSIQQLSELCDELSKRRDALNREIAIEEDHLHRMDGRSIAAEALEKRELLASQIREHADEYVRLQLASFVLNGAMERFRERNQGPVLERASKLFEVLTGGSFIKLISDNEEDQAVLMGMRSDGRRVHVAGPQAGMSEGTCDQLYLALRLASLESWLADHPPIPLVIDDILVNFDDQRSTAALKVLAELSKKTQIILFTHHQHLVTLAHNSIDQQQLFVHQLA
ncbi:MAG: AAA family ATPase [Pirellulaceae bacterium]|nr:AAA family ATPase [Pirellulaceae bacterium]